jgi:hypothetical protein
MLYAYLYSDRMWLLNLQVCYACYQLRFFHQKLSTMHACEFAEIPTSTRLRSIGPGRDKFVQSLIRTPACSAPLSTSVQLHLCRSGHVSLLMYSVLHAPASMPVSYSCPWGQSLFSVYSHKVVQIFLGTLASFIISTLKNHSHELVRYVSPWHLDSSEIRNHQHYSTIWDSGYNIKICSSLAC